MIQRQLLKSPLIERGCTVWILDRAGQGGSGRYVLPRDLGFAPSFDPDVTALHCAGTVPVELLVVRRTGAS